ncbi:MAG: hypothetical protein ASARMPRED_006000 [Alectoria sarmentosa]|nr:MAG: hypothetical protein ASARMPRED_006000 [Alectoria sarmentosa]
MGAVLQDAHAFGFSRICNSSKLARFSDSRKAVELLRKSVGDWATKNFELLVAATVLPLVPPQSPQLGPGTARLKKGDEILGFVYQEIEQEAHQEMMCVSKNQLALLLDSFTMQEAVTLPKNFVTVFHTLNANFGLELPWPKPEFERVIICAANFAMGWMSKLLATASKRNHLLLKESGVSNVLDYDVPLAPIAKIAEKETTVAVLLPVIVRDASETQAPVTNVERHRKEKALDFFTFKPNLSDDPALWYPSRISKELATTIELSRDKVQSSDARWRTKLSRPSILILKIVRRSKSAFRWVLKGRPHPGNETKGSHVAVCGFQRLPQRSHSARPSEQSACTNQALTFTPRETRYKAKPRGHLLDIPPIKKPTHRRLAMLQKLIELATAPYHRLTSRTPSPAPSSPTITMKATILSNKPSRVSPRANKGVFTSTRLDEEPNYLPQKAGKKKSATKAPSTKKTPKAIRKARAPKKRAPARAAFDPKAK